jgi:hypothetical protein
MTAGAHLAIVPAGFVMSRGMIHGLRVRVSGRKVGERSQAPLPARTGTTIVKSPAKPMRTNMVIAVPPADPSTEPVTRRVSDRLAP